MVVDHLPHFILAVQEQVARPLAVWGSPLISPSKSSQDYDWRHARYRTLGFGQRDSALASSIGRSVVRSRSVACRIAACSLQ